MAKKPAAAAGANRGVLGWIEKTGNKLPDPAFLFLYLIGFLVAGSVVAAVFGYSAQHPTTGDAIRAQSLLSVDNLRRLFVNMPQTFAHFHPLGYVVVVMLGAGVAERAGLIGTAMRAAVKGAPIFLLTPFVAFAAMMGNLAADAAYVVLIPLAGVLYAAAGRHPIAGIAAAFAGVSGGFSANLLPGQLDALLFGITQAGAQQLDPNWSFNLAGNWWFIAAMFVLYLPVIWFVTDVIIERRLGKWAPETPEQAKAIGDGGENRPLAPEEKKGLARAGMAVLIVSAFWALVAFVPDVGGLGQYLPFGALYDFNAADPVGSWAPFLQSMVAYFFVLFFVAGWAYGAAAGTVKDHRDAVKMMSGAMSDLAYYFVLAFTAAHFVAMFNWSNLGLIFAVQGADAIRSAGLSPAALFISIILMGGAINLFIGSASAKWALLAPVVVPMLMLLGYSPESATAAYRVGDSATNIITPLMVYLPLVLIFAQRWKSDFGLGSLIATMLPYSVWLLIGGIGLMAVWVTFGFDFGPYAPLHYALPEAGP